GSRRPWPRWNLSPSSPSRGAWRSAPAGRPRVRASGARAPGPPRARYTPAWPQGVPGTRRPRRSRVSLPDNVDPAPLGVRAQGRVEDLLAAQAVLEARPHLTTCQRGVHPRHDVAAPGAHAGVKGVDHAEV